MKPTHLIAALALFGVVTTSAFPNAARAQAEPPSWLLKYISYYYNIGSNRPNTQERTILALHGWFPYDCGLVTGAYVIDQGHIALTLRPNDPMCRDTTRQWDRGFDLGFLPLGDHTLNVRRTFVAASGDSVTENASFTFPVIDLGAPPPPPPPPGPGPVFTSYYTIPAPPVADAPTTLVLQGAFPYDCGEIADVVVHDSHHVSFTMQPGPACPDSTPRAWSQEFNLGVLPEGSHEVFVVRNFIGPDSSQVTQTSLFLYVWPDSATPPPPPPPEIPRYLLKYMTGANLIPAQPHALAPTTLVLHGVFPYDCGEIADVAVPDSANVSFTMKPGPACGDTVRSWSQAFDLGYLPKGYHSMWITRRFVSPDSNVVNDALYGFTVWQDPNTPPPPPPPVPTEYPSVGVRCLSGWYTTTPPTSAAPTTLVLWGWFPYLCGSVTVLSATPDAVALRLRPPNGGVCLDTTVTWSQSIDLGILPPGPHPITITLDVGGDIATEASVRQTIIYLDVSDEPVTSSVPNPFVTDTRFTVVNPERGRVEIGIFDVNGRRVATLFQGDLPAGSREFRWDGNRDDGSRAAIGVYFSRVAFSNRVVTRRLVMLPRR